MDKKYIVLLVLVCGILGGGLFAIRGTMDRVAPEIQIPEAQAEYHIGDTKEVLLKDVTAVDDKDGDVTDSLVVENVFTDEEKGVATVVYVAKDSSNNVAKVTRYMTYTAETQTEEQTEQETEKQTAAPQAKPKKETEQESETVAVLPGETETQQTEDVASVSEIMYGMQESETQAADVQPVVEEEDLDAYYEGIFAELSSEVPHLRLTNRKIVIKVGDSFDPLLYVQSITDDYDNKYELWRQINVDGEVNTKIPGIYQLIYTATDSSGNVSNRAMLLVDVQGEYGDETAE